MDVNLSDYQKKVLGTAMTILAGAVVMFATIVALVYLSRFFQAFWHVFLPLAVAGVLATMLDPWYAFLRRRLPAVAALLLVYLSILAPIVLIILVFGSLIMTQLMALLEQISALWEAMYNWVWEHHSGLLEYFQTDGIGRSIEENLGWEPVIAFAQHLMNYLTRAGASITSSMVALLGWAILPVYLAYFLVMPKLRPGSLEPDHLPFLKTGTAADVIYLIQEFFSLVIIFFRSQVIIALIQGGMFAIGFSLIGLKYGIVLGLMLGLLNIIPYLGSIIGLAVCLPIAWFQDGGGGSLLALVLVIFILVQLMESYLLTPRILGDAIGLPPMAIIVGIFFWSAALDGVLGIILAIPLTAFVVVVYRLVRQKYIRQIV